MPHPLYPSATVDALAAACYARVRPGTLRQWRRRGRITPCGGTARHPLYSLADLDRALAGRASPSAT